MSANLPPDVRFATVHTPAPEARLTPRTVAALATTPSRKSKARLFGFAAAGSTAAIRPDPRSGRQ